MAYKRISPTPIVEGGTGLTSGTTDGTIYYDGSKFVTTATGTAAKVLTSNGPGVAPTYQSLPAGTIVTKFTASGTWTINPVTKWVDLFVFGGGGGGGSGQQGTSGNAVGGGGGGTSPATYVRAPAQAFNAAGETVTIGGGGTGGLAQGSINSNGNNGGLMTVSSLGNINITPSASPALGGQGDGGGPYGGPAGFSMQLATAKGGATGGDSDPSGGPKTGGTAVSFGCGAGGAGFTANSATPQAGGVGGRIVVINSNVTAIAGGLAGIASGTINGGDGNPGATANVDCLYGGSGGGGGGGQSTVGGAVAGTGGKGGIPGGGGGGGGGSINGTPSGAGGDGARGEIWVIEYL